MSLLLLTGLLFVLFTLGLAYAEQSRSSATGLTTTTMGVVVQETFAEQAALNTRFWRSNYPGRYTTPSNGEMQWYQPAALSLQADGLHLSPGLLGVEAQAHLQQTLTEQTTWDDQQYTVEALLKREGGATLPAAQHLKYQSGMLSTYDTLSVKPEPGKPVLLEVTAKLPKGKGLWPAIWLMPKPEWVQTEAYGYWKENAPPEIDVLETWGNENWLQKLHMGHYWGKKLKESQHEDVTLPKQIDLRNDFHTYGLLWETSGRMGKLTWLLDGKTVHSSTKNVPTEPMYLIVNLAIGYKDPGWGGYPEPNETFGRPENDFVIQKVSIKQ